MLLVGNDIVDLSVAGVSGKSREVRFVNRVFTEQEKSAIGEHSDPDTILWMLWAAKEAAYKVVSKHDSPPVFSHKRFRTELKTITCRDRGCFQAKLRVDYGSHHVEVEMFGNPERLHCVGAPASQDEEPDCELFSDSTRWAPDESGPRECGGDHGPDFTALERESIHHEASALVRRQAKHDIGAKLGLDPARLQIVRPVKDNKMLPPYLLIDGNRTSIDISLSHHGKWVGWACTIPKGKTVLL